MKKDSGNSYLYLLIIVIVGFGVMFGFFMIPKIVEQYAERDNANNNEIVFMVIDYDNDKVVIAEIEDIINGTAAVKFIDSFTGVLKIGDIVDENGNLIARGDDTFEAYAKTLKIEGYYTPTTEIITDDGIVIG